MNHTEPARRDPIRIAVVVEGPSEQQFVTNFLAPYLAGASSGRIYAQAMTVKTSLAANGRLSSGGGG